MCKFDNDAYGYQLENEGRRLNGGRISDGLQAMKMDWQMDWLLGGDVCPIGDEMMGSCILRF